MRKGPTCQAWRADDGTEGVFHAPGCACSFDAPRERFERVGEGELHEIGSSGVYVSHYKGDEPDGGISVMDAARLLAALS